VDKPFFPFQFKDLRFRKPCGRNPGLQSAEPITSPSFALGLWISPFLYFFYPQPCSLTALGACAAPEFFAFCASFRRKKGEPAAPLLIDADCSAGKASSSALLACLTYQPRVTCALPTGTRTRLTEAIGVVGATPALSGAILLKSQTNSVLLRLTTA